MSEHKSSKVYLKFLLIYCHCTCQCNDSAITSENSLCIVGDKNKLMWTKWISIILYSNDTIAFFWREMLTILEISFGFSGSKFTFGGFKFCFSTTRTLRTRVRNWRMSDSLNNKETMKNVIREVTSIKRSTHLYSDTELLTRSCLPQPVLSGCRALLSAPQYHELRSKVECVHKCTLL